MTKGDQKTTHIERITMGGCTCKTCDVNDSNGNHKEYPIMHCGITCKKNDIVKQECSCIESINCPKGSIVFESDHSLSLEKLKTFKKDNSESENIIKNCIDGNDELKYIYILFGNTMKNGTLTANLYVTKDDEEHEEQNDIEVAKKIDFPIDIFQNKTDIQIDAAKINQNSANMTNKDLGTNHILSQNYDYETENFCKQIGEDSFENELVATAIIGSLFFVSALFIGIGFLYKKYRYKTTETNLEDSNNVI